MNATLLGFGSGATALPALWVAADALANSKLARLSVRLTAPLAIAVRDGDYHAARAGGRELAVATAAACLITLICIGTLEALLVGLALPVLVIRAAALRSSRIRRSVDGSMPVMLRTLSDATAAGRPISQAIADLGNEAATGAAKELSILSSAQQRGARFDEAASRMASAAHSRQWPAVITVLELHRRAGGDLPASLNALATSFEQTSRDRDAVRASTAQARFTGSIVCALPLLAAATGELLVPGSVVGIVSQPLAAVIALLALLLQVGSLLLIRRLSASSTPSQ